MKPDENFSFTLNKNTNIQLIPSKNKNINIQTKQQSDSKSKKKLVQSNSNLSDEIQIKKLKQLPLNFHPDLNDPYNTYTTWSPNNDLNDNINLINLKNDPHEQFELISGESEQKSHYSQSVQTDHDHNQHQILKLENDKPKNQTQLTVSRRNSAASIISHKSKLNEELNHQFNKSVAFDQKKDDVNVYSQEKFDNYTNESKNNIHDQEKTDNFRKNRFKDNQSNSHKTSVIDILPPKLRSRIIVRSPLLVKYSSNSMKNLNSENKNSKSSINKSFNFNLDDNKQRNNKVTKLKVNNSFQTQEDMLDLNSHTNFARSKSMVDFSILGKNDNGLEISSKVSSQKFNIKNPQRKFVQRNTVNDQLMGRQVSPKINQKQVDFNKQQDSQSNILSKIKQVRLIDNIEKFKSDVQEDINNVKNKHLEEQRNLINKKDYSIQLKKSLIQKGKIKK